jgi:hypothetical protein
VEGIGSRRGRLVAAGGGYRLSVVDQGFSVSTSGIPTWGRKALPGRRREKASGRGASRGRLRTEIQEPTTARRRRPTVPPPATRRASSHGPPGPAARRTPGR